MITQAEIKHIRSLAVKKYRDSSGLFVVEGEKMVAEAEASGFSIEKIYRRDEIGPAAMARISLTDSPSPVLALVRKPSDTISDQIPSEGLYLGLDSIRDPGNLGTIIRVADWFGIDGIYASHDTVDFFNPKVIQATMGSIFRVPLHYADLPLLCKGIAAAGGGVYGTFLDGDDIYALSRDSKLGKTGIIITGNESRGISPEVAATVTARICIPRHPSTKTSPESLNAAVATAITLAEFRRSH